MNKNQILKEYYGYNNLKKEQEEIIDYIMDNLEVIGLLPTGYGKSITFQIPALLLTGITIVVTPLISLMQDQVRTLKERYIKAEYINSLQDEFEQEIIYKKILGGKVKILYVSAERLLTQRFKTFMKNINISLIVCDEAHTLLWGEDFREALFKISEFIDVLSPRPRILALTATATNNTIDVIKKVLKLNNPKVVIGDCDRRNIYYKVVHVKNKIDYLMHYIKLASNKKGIIYTLTINTAKKLYDSLMEKNINVGLYHGRLSSYEKKEVQEYFTRGKLNLIICTNAFGMGIDIPDIRYVIEYELPSSIEDFSQQTGRASRDGKYAEAIILFNKDDIRTSEFFINNIEKPNLTDKQLKTIKVQRFIKLDKMISLCLSKKCIHQKIANYFGVKHSGKCGMCSNCKKKV